MKTVEAAPRRGLLLPLAVGRFVASSVTAVPSPSFPKARIALVRTWPSPVPAVLRTSGAADFIVTIR